MWGGLSDVTSRNTGNWLVCAVYAIGATTTGTFVLEGTIDSQL